MAFIVPKCPTCDKTVEVLLESTVETNVERNLCNDCVAKVMADGRTVARLRKEIGPCVECTLKLAAHIWEYKTKKRIKILKCGHSILADTIMQSDEEVTALNGDKLMPFQVEGVKFIEDAGLRGAILDDMGLGKTCQSLVVMKKHPEAWPFIVFCKSGLKTQWSRAIINWCGPEFVPQTVEDGNAQLLPGFRCYIVSLDILRRLNADKTAEPGDRADRVDVIADSISKNPFLVQIKRVGIKTIIIDECQLLKNTVSQRTIHVRRLAKEVPYLIPLSGTAVKNNAGEAFSILNMLRPDRYHNEARYLRDEVQMVWTGRTYKPGGLKDPEDFWRRNGDFLIRRKREDVLPQLPKITRNFQFCDLGKEVEAAYMQTVKEFQEYHNNNSDSAFKREESIMRYLTKMRYLTGMSKIEPTADFVLDFLVETGRRMVVFLHHIDVGTLLMERLNLSLPEELKEEGLNVVRLESGNKETWAEKIDRFQSGKARLMIASTLAAGEGLNLQICSDCVLMERQWNPANELQAEDRFVRIGQLADKVTATYMIAVGTIDEFFTELVEQKREWIKSTLDGKRAEPYTQAHVMQELVKVLAAKGGRKWGF